MDAVNRFWLTYFIIVILAPASVFLANLPGSTVADAPVISWMSIHFFLRLFSFFRNQIFDYYNLECIMIFYFVLQIGWYLFGICTLALKFSYETHYGLWLTMLITMVVDFVFSVCVTAGVKTFCFQYQDFRLDFNRAVAIPQRVEVHVERPANPPAPVERPAVNPVAQIGPQIAFNIDREVKAVNDILNALPPELPPAQPAPRLQHPLVRMLSGSVPRENPKIKSHNFYNQCAVCIEDFKEGQTVKELPCQHIFHGECIDPWLAKSKNCPVCKNSVE